MNKKYTKAEMLANHRGRKQRNCYDDMETAFVDVLLKENKELRARLKEKTDIQIPDIAVNAHCIYQVPQTTLITGEKLVAKLINGEREYEFVGLDLEDLQEGVGCRYLVLHPVGEPAGVTTCVEAAWLFHREAHLPKGGE